MDRLETMRAFVRVAESGSFTAVANEMDVARSVVTRQVADLEAHLGVKLIARSTRRLSLTSAGAGYLDTCRNILSLVEAAETGLADERQVPRGHLRISVPLSFGLRHLSPLLIDFATTYPDVTVELDFTDRKVNLIEEGIDVAIRVAGRLEPHDVARRISVCRSVVLASPDYLRRHGEPAHPADLAQHECLGYVPVLRSAWPFLVDGQTRSFPVRGRLLANNGDALLDAAIRGLGITCQPTFIAAPAIEAGQVKPILARYARVFVDYLVARIGPEPYWDDAFMAAGRPKAEGGSRAKRPRKS